MQSKGGRNWCNIVPESWQRKAVFLFIRIFKENYLPKEEEILGCQKHLQTTINKPLSKNSNNYPFILPWSLPHGKIKHSQDSSQTGSLFIPRLLLAVWSIPCKHWRKPTSDFFVTNSYATIFPLSPRQILVSSNWTSLGSSSIAYWECTFYS